MCDVSKWKERNVNVPCKLVVGAKASGEVSAVESRGWRPLWALLEASLQVWLGSLSPVCSCVQPLGSPCPPPQGASPGPQSTGAPAGDHESQGDHPRRMPVRQEDICVAQEHLMGLSQGSLGHYFQTQSICVQETFLSC